MANGWRSAVAAARQVLHHCSWPRTHEVGAVAVVLELLAKVRAVDDGGLEGVELNVLEVLLDPLEAQGRHALALLLDVVLVLRDALGDGVLLEGEHEGHEHGVLELLERGELVLVLHAAHVARATSGVHGNSSVTRPQDENAGWG